uniref:Uncharacterized protein n=1 Tax=Elaeophora elaphi TaxID=1147741 RepID=A0A0R3RRT2_9BILA
MVSDQEKFRSDNNCKYTNCGKGDINRISYDNMKLTRTSMSLSSSSSSSSTSTTLKTAENCDHDAETLEKLSIYYRSTTATPTVTQESTTNTVTSGRDSGHTSAGTVTRPLRAYRIIDSNVSQKILQKLVAEKLAAAQKNGKGSARFLKRKGSSKGTSSFFFQRQSNFGSQIWSRSEELSNVSKAPIFRTHFDVVRTSSFSGNQTQTIRKNLECNRSSLPISIVSFNSELF